MSSEGPGSPIARQDADDLLHKLVTESTRVQVLFTASEWRIKVAIPGRIKLAPDDTLWVMEEHEQPGAPLFVFDPVPAVAFRYADSRDMVDSGEGPYGLNFRSLLRFDFANRSTLSIFEFSAQDESR